MHYGGGKVLLEALLVCLRGDEILILDSRFSLQNGFNKYFFVKRVAPSTYQRFFSEFWLFMFAHKVDIVLCFGNLPPLFKLRTKVVLFLQNKFLIENFPLNNFSLKVRLRLKIERYWLAMKINNVDEVIVQTSSMKLSLEKHFGNKLCVKVLPFVSNPSGYSRRNPTVITKKIRLYDFVYVASGEPHKNHRTLVEAWCALARQGLFPSLCLTFDQTIFGGLHNFLEEKRVLHGLKIFNVGNLTHSDILNLYGNSGAAIFPSKFESFGLPLLEARQAGLSILAAELDYVRDVIDPEESFNPDSPISISRSVKRFLGINEGPLPLSSANNFLDELIGAERR